MENGGVIDVRNEPVRSLWIHGEWFKESKLYFFVFYRVFNMTLRAIDQFTGTDGKQFYAFDGRGFDQAHPKSNPKRMDPNTYKMNLSNGRLYEGKSSIK